MPKKQTRRQDKKTKRVKRSGGGYMMPQQGYDPDVLPPSTLFSTGLTSQANETMVRPVLPATFQTGGGYQMPQQWFDPAMLPPTTLWPTQLSTTPTTTMIRPVLPATFQNGAGSRGITRRGIHGMRGIRGNQGSRKGGFVPSVMGPFLANAQAAVVPLAFLALYHTTVPKKVGGIVGGLIKSAKRTLRRNTRKLRK